MKRSIKGILFLVLFCGGILISGCETTTSASKGIDDKSAGAAKEVVTPWDALMKLDSWIRENLW